MRGRAEWGVRLEADWVWELDSSAPAKWSRHVVVRLPGAALRDTAAAGALVARLLSRPEVWDASGPLISLDMFSRTSENCFLAPWQH